MSSPELLMPREEMPEYSFASYDKNWLRSLGCSWDKEDDSVRLAELTELLTIASEPVKPGDYGADLRALTARMNFVYLFKNLDIETNDAIVSHSDWRLSFASVIGTQRLLQSHGIDNLKVVTNFPQILSLTPPNIKSKLDNLSDHGLNPTKVVNNRPFVLSFTPKNINTRLRVLQSAARSWKVENYTEEVKQLIEQFPDPLTLTADRNRVLMRVLNKSLQPGSRLSLKQIALLFHNNFEGILAGYLEIEKLPTSSEYLVRQGARYKKLGRQTMRSIILDPAHSEDQAARAYRRMLDREAKKSERPIHPSLYISK